MTIKRGEVWLASLDPVPGSEQVFWLMWDAPDRVGSVSSLGDFFPREIK
jgi:hypothetical protein